MDSAQEKIIIIGAGGAGKVIASVIEDARDAGKNIDIEGFLDDGLEKDKIINGHPVLGPVSEYTNYLKKNNIFFIYSLINPTEYRKRINMLVKKNIPARRFATIVHPTAVVSRYSSLGYGVVLMPGVVVSPNVTLGNNVLIFANSFIGHDTVVEDNCFIANCVSIGSTVRLCNGSYVGSNASVLEKVTMGKFSMAGLGSVILKDVPPNKRMVGNPAKVLD
jgi:acetyltransferase EpsM